MVTINNNELGKMLQKRTIEVDKTQGYFRRIHKVSKIRKCENGFFHLSIHLNTHRLNLLKNRQTKIMFLNLYF